jgi:hypothetical protein
LLQQHSSRTTPWSTLQRQEAACQLAFRYSRIFTGKLKKFNRDKRTACRYWDLSLFCR